jgi:hypothetical protein
MHLNWSEHVLCFPSSNTSVDNLFHDLFVDQWLTEINYEKYFNECAPSLCTYTTTRQINFSFALTLFISLYGGLIIILRLTALFLVRVFLRCRSTNAANPYGKYPISIVFREMLTMYDVLGSWSARINKFGQFFKHLNLFKMADRRTQNDIKQQRVFTRVYLISLFGMELPKM